MREGVYDFYVIPGQCKVESKNRLVLDFLLLKDERESDC